MEEKVLRAIGDERNYQDMLWGTQNHSPEHWVTILMEEVGEVAKAVLENDNSEYVDEMVQVAAVVIAALECYRRNEGIK